MPYIKYKRRLAMEDALNLLSDEIASPGDLAYAMTVLCLSLGPIQSFASIATILGVLDSVSKEFYRRVALPYEESKREENGDVF